MQFVKIKEINHYKSKSISPFKTPDKIFETYSVPSFDSGHPEYLRGDEIASSKLIVQKDDVLLCKINPRINRVWVVADESDNQNIASSEWIVIRNESYNPRFLAWYFRSLKFQQLMTSEVAGIGGSLTRAQPKRVSEYPAPVLKRDQQDRIVQILDQVSAIQAARQKQLRALDELVKARFIEMFGDVIINEKQWDKYIFSDIASSRLGKMLDGKRQTGKCQFPYLANFNVQWFKFNLDNLNQMDFDENDRVEFALEEGDLLVCEGGEIGRCAVWHNEIQPCYFQKAIHRVRCYQNVILPDYLAWWFKYNCENNGFMAIEGAKATIAHLPGVKLKKLQVTVPPLHLQKQFAAFVTQVDNLKSKLRESLTQTETLFNSLMQQYFG